MSPFIKFARLQLPLIFALLVGANRLHATDVIQRKKLNDIFVKQLKQKKEKRLQKKKKKLSKQKKVATIVTIMFVVAMGVSFHFRSSSKKKIPLREGFTVQQPNHPEEFEEPLKTLGNGYFGMEPIGKLDIKIPKKEGTEVFYIYEIRGDNNSLFHATVAPLIYQLSHKEDAVEYTLEKVDLIVEKAKICVEKITNWKKNLEDLRDNFNEKGGRYEEVYRGYFDRYYEWYVDTRGNQWLEIPKDKQIPSKFLEKIDCYLKKNLLFHTVQNSFGFFEDTESDAIDINDRMRRAREFLGKSDDEKKRCINAIFNKRIEIIEEILPRIEEVANSKSHERVENIFKVLFSKSNLAEQLEWFNNHHDSIIFFSDWFRKVAFIMEHLLNTDIPLQNYVPISFFQKRKAIVDGTWMGYSSARKVFRLFNLIVGQLGVTTIVEEKNSQDPLSLENNFPFRIIDFHVNKSPYQNDVIMAMGRYGSTSGQMNSFRLGILKGKMRKPYPTRSN